FMSHALLVLEFFFFFFLLWSPRISTLFPYTTLFRSQMDGLRTSSMTSLQIIGTAAGVAQGLAALRPASGNLAYTWQEGLFNDALDRKSTRLNSSHVKISYAVFCLKKKKNRCLISKLT